MCVCVCVCVCVCLSGQDKGKIEGLACPPLSRDDGDAAPADANSRVPQNRIVLGMSWE